MVARAHDTGFTVLRFRVSGIGSQLGFRDLGTYRVRAVGFTGFRGTSEARRSCIEV